MDSRQRSRTANNGALCFAQPMPLTNRATLLHHLPHRATCHRHRPCGGTPARMSATSGAQLRRRIATVQSAEKIVSALRLVAAARIRSSSNAALRSRPFAEELQTVLSQLLSVINARRIDVASVAASLPNFTLADLNGPLLMDPTVQSTLLNSIYLTLLSPEPTASSSVVVLTIVTADRKFCGSYNKEVLQKADQRIGVLLGQGFTVRLVLIGKIAISYFRRACERLSADVQISKCLQTPSLVNADTVAKDLSQLLLVEFISAGHRVRRIEIVYTRFISLIATLPSVRTLLPLRPTGLEAINDELFQLTVTSKNGRIVPQRMDSNNRNGNGNGNGYHDSVTHSKEHATFLKQSMYNISDEEAVLLLNSILPMYFTSQMIRIVREAIASEQVSRLMAMTAATDNARDLISSLQTQYNKQRQARITTEIIEVISNVT